MTGVANEPGVLGGLARRFAEAGININLVYMAADTRIVLGVDDMDAKTAETVHREAHGLVADEIYEVAEGS